MPGRASPPLAFQEHVFYNRTIWPSMFSEDKNANPRNLRASSSPKSPSEYLERFGGSEGGRGTIPPQSTPPHPFSLLGGQLFIYANPPHMDPACNFPPFNRICCTRGPLRRNCLQLFCPSRPSPGRRRPPACPARTLPGACVTQVPEVQVSPIPSSHSAPDILWRERRSSGALAQHTALQSTQCGAVYHPVSDPRSGQRHWPPEPHEGY